LFCIIVCLVSVHSSHSVEQRERSVRMLLSVPAWWISGLCFVFTDDCRNVSDEEREWCCSVDNDFWS